MENTFWDKQIIITEVAGEKSMTKISLVEKDGKQFVDVRKFVKAKGAEEGTFTQHTSSGISIPLESLGGMATALSMAKEVVAKGGFALIKKERKPRAKKSA